MHDARALLIGLAAACWPTAVQASVVVLVNSTPEPVAYQLRIGQQPSQPGQIEPAQVRPLRFAGQAVIEFRSGQQPASYELKPNSIYVFVAQPGKLDLQQVALGGEMAAAAAVPQPAGEKAPGPNQPAPGPGEDASAARAATERDATQPAPRSSSP